MIRLISYGCASAAGATSEHFWKSLQKGAVHTGEASGNLFSLSDNLSQAWSEARCRLQGDIGVILASTKGSVEDFVWTKAAANVNSDPLTPVLDDFLARAEIKPSISVCVSNACVSSHSALWLAEKWLLKERVRHVVILACDQIGPFVLKGFQTLKVLSSGEVRPFSKDRDGLQLGSAAAAIILSASPDAHGPELLGVGLVADGSALTRPSESGRALREACLQIEKLKSNPPDVIVAHGTGTIMNDQTEDETFTEVFGSNSPRPVITSTKWCIGHTMGASGAMDLIAACKILESQKVFRIATTEKNDPTFRNDYATVHSKPFDRKIQNVLVSSLGFGGVHSAALLRV